MSEELRKCPFCGEQPERYSFHGGFSIFHGCSKHTHGMNETNWNTRPLEDALQAERDLLLAKLAEYEGENKRWHSFETVQAIVKERDLLRQKLEVAKEFHPRAMSLIEKQQNFVVVANDEPYFEQVYSLIREDRLKTSRWSIEDENNYKRAIAKLGEKK